MNGRIAGISVGVNASDAFDARDDRLPGEVAATQEARDATYMPGRLIYRRLPTQARYGTISGWPGQSRLTPSLGVEAA